MQYGGFAHSVKYQHPFTRHKRTGDGLHRRTIRIDSTGLEHFGQVTWVAAWFR